MASARFNTPTVLVVAALAWCGCEGNVGLNQQPGPEEQHTPGPIQDRMPTEEDCSAGGEVFTNDAPARLMTRYEFDNTVADLVGVNAGYAWENFPSENSTGGFENNVDSHVVSPLHVRKLLEVTELIATEAVANGALDDGVAALVYRAFRRPPSSDEVTTFEKLHSTAGETWGATRADEIVVTAILQSPQFLYRLELIDQEVPKEIIQNDSFEMASRLSYMLWSTMPDEELFAIAERAELQTDEQIEGQVRRMLKDSRAAATVGHFYRQWLHLGSLDGSIKDETAFEGVTETFSQDWRASIDAFVQHVHFEEGGTLRDLMTSSTVFLTPDLARLYGEQSVTGLTQATMEHRSGLLTQPALLALLAYPDQGSPIHRGIFVREKILCQMLGPPPDIMLEPPDPDPNGTTRERFKEHAENDACSGCHMLIDPIGLGFESYDGVGRFRTTENGLPVDASGALTHSGDEAIDGPFDGAADLAGRLAGSTALSDCIADQWMTFSMGQRPTQADLCSAQQVRERFAETDGSFEELLVAIAMSDAMRYRTVQAER